MEHPPGARVTSHGPTTPIVAEGAPEEAEAARKPPAGHLFSATCHGDERAVREMLSEGAEERAPLAREHGWKGLVYSNFSLSFSGTANRHIVNHQEVPAYDSGKDPHCPWSRSRKQGGAAPTQIPPQVHSRSP